MQSTRALSVVHDASPDIVFLKRSQVGVAIAGEAEEVLHKRPVVGEDRTGAEERAQFGGSSPIDIEQLIEGVRAEIVRTLRAAGNLKLSREITPAQRRRSIASACPGVGCGTRSGLPLFASSE